MYMYMYIDFCYMKEQREISYLKLYEENMFEGHLPKSTKKKSNILQDVQIAGKPIIPTANNLTFVKNGSNEDKIISRGD